MTGRVSTAAPARLVLNPRSRPSDIPAPGRQAFEWHRSLPGYCPTPLRSLPSLAESLGLERLLVKDESSRFDLPSFKALGASWTTRQLLREHRGTRIDALVAASDGNHGHAVAAVARERGLDAVIYLPPAAVPARVDAIRKTGARVITVPGTYDDAVSAAAAHAARFGSALLVTDTSVSAADPSARATIDGYATIFWEIGDQLARAGLEQPDLVMLQVGVGGLAAAGVRHFRAEPTPQVMVGVEPLDAAPAFESLRSGGPVRVDLPARAGRMVGLEAGVVSAAAWPSLRDGLDAAVAISDVWCSQAIEGLVDVGIATLPTGAAGLAGLLALAAMDRRPKGLVWRGSALVIVTEGDDGSGLAWGPPSRRRFQWDTTWTQQRTLRRT
ncbi:MAG: pyridoxal-phosphate dependent enzyme [Actinomycetota bacterium]